MRNHSISFHGRRARRITKYFRILSGTDKMFCLHFNETGGQVGKGAWESPETLLTEDNQQFIDDMEIYNESGILLTDEELQRRQQVGKVHENQSMRERERELAVALNISVDTFQKFVQHIIERMQTPRIRDRELMWRKCHQLLQQNKSGRFLKDANTSNVSISGV